MRQTKRQWTMRRSFSHICRLFSTNKHVALSSAHAKQTMSVLRPDCYHLSPAIGLIALNSPCFMANLMSCTTSQELQWGLGSSCSLARELFFQAHPGDHIRTTRSRSKAISHLDVKLLGHVVGLAVSRAEPEVVASTLRTFGIESNKIRGVWTGVSFVRFTRLVDLIAVAWHGNQTTPALMMILQVVWEKSTDKACLLDFILALDKHYPVLAEEHQALKHDVHLQEAFVSSHFEFSELTEESLGKAAADVVHTECDLTYARGMEVMAVSLSQVQAFKPAIKLERHPYKGGLLCEAWFLLSSTSTLMRSPDL
jgi:hypothetical protein